MYYFSATFRWCLAISAFLSLGFVSSSSTSSIHSRHAILFVGVSEIWRQGDGQQSTVARPFLPPPPPPPSPGPSRNVGWPRSHLKPQSHRTKNRSMTGLRLAVLTESCIDVRQRRTNIQSSHSQTTPWAPSHPILHPRAGRLPLRPHSAVAWLAAGRLILF